MRLLDRLPFGEGPHLVSVGTETVQVHRNQIIVWISIGNLLRPFPAILDSGHGHNLSISRRQLVRWGGVEIGELDVNGQPVVQYAAEVRVHRNLPRRTGLRGDSYPLEMPQGLSVFEADAPRLPLIGLRTLVSNRLKLLIDGERREVTLRRRGWFSNGKHP